MVAPINKHDWLSFARRVELVLLQEPACKAPSGTLPWLKLRPGLVRHHHVRLPEVKDVARLCRWITGKAVGLVLSGAPSLFPPFCTRLGSVCGVGLLSVLARQQGLLSNTGVVAVHGEGDACHV